MISYIVITSVLFGIFFQPLSQFNGVDILWAIIYNLAFLPELISVLFLFAAIITIQKQVIKDQDTENNKQAIAVHLISFSLFGTAVFMRMTYVTVQYCSKKDVQQLIIINFWILTVLDFTSLVLLLYIFNNLVNKQIQFQL